jgi:hypothetical protein
VTRPWARGSVAARRSSANSFSAFGRTSSSSSAKTPPSGLAEALKVSLPEPAKHPKYREVAVRRGVPIGEDSYEALFIVLRTLSGFNFVNPDKGWMHRSDEVFESVAERVAAALRD